MSKPNEERDIYYIPPNFLTSGRLFGGMIRARNAIEACVLVLGMIDRNNPMSSQNVTESADCGIMRLLPHAARPI